MNDQNPDDSGDIRGDESSDSEPPDVFRGLADATPVVDRGRVRPPRAEWNGESATVEGPVPCPAEALSVLPAPTDPPRLSAPEGFDFDAFYLAHHGQLLTRLTRYCAGDRALAEDVTQQTFLQAYYHRAQLPELENPADWLYVVATRAARTIFKREGLRRDRACQYVKTAAPAAEPMESVLLNDLIDRLPEREGLIITYRYLLGYQREQIVTLMGVSLRTVDYSIKKGLDILKSFIDPGKEDQR